jgi:hypothetical protein
MLSLNRLMLKQERRRRRHRRRIQSHSKSPLTLSLSQRSPLFGVSVIHLCYTNIHCTFSLELKHLLIPQVSVLQKPVNSLTETNWIAGGVHFVCLSWLCTLVNSCNIQYHACCVADGSITNGHSQAGERSTCSGPYLPEVWHTMFFHIQKWR